MPRDLKPEAQEAGQQGFAPPVISLPKGGGAIRGIGEKFSANPVTGTGSMSVPIATSPGRSGFAPQLSLAYDSGAGNGAFGFGWTLSVPTITRKTDKGLPKYQDANESDVFVLSGSEDLVPVLIDKGNGEWGPEPLPLRTIDVDRTYRIQRYRPRIEGLFARIERWINIGKPEDTFWRSISKDNITTWYGKTPESRIHDPSDESRIFSWLICESYDDKGNVIVHGYRKEDSDGVDRRLAHERNRNDVTRAANRYLKRIRYGNHAPYFPGLAEDQPWPTPPGAVDEDGGRHWFFEVVFDYGDHDLEAPLPLERGRRWGRRNDPFSSYRSGFEVRIYRLCRRVLMFHHFPDEPGVGSNCLVRTTDFTYAHEQDPTSAQNPVFSLLSSVTQSGYRLQADGTYLKQSLPPLEFEYRRPTIDETVREIDPRSLENLPQGLGNGAYQWVDLDGEGLSGILAEQTEGWFYKRNLSPFRAPRETGQEPLRARFAPLEQQAQKPSLAANRGGRQQLLDLAGDGQLDLVDLDRPTPGFYERTEDEHWETFVPFTALPNLDWNNPNLRFVDLTGDGHVDILIAEDDVFCWYPSLAEAGFGPSALARKALDDEKGPKLVFADGTQSVYLSDMSGDGLTDLVRIRNGEVCYWPNLGYGRFGAKLTMDNAPWFDAPDLFDQRRIRLADVDGSGVTDILYLGRGGVRIYFNQSGNSWSEPAHLTRFPPIDDATSVTVVDLLGTGTACLVWSSSLPGDARRPTRYIDLMSGGKPHLMVRAANNLGAETRLRYAPSTRFYIEDRLAGRPWISRVPFPVHVVERVETYDWIGRNRFVTRYAYHHGCFDGEEREFRGFGMVEQFDTEEFAALSSSDDFPAGDNVDPVSYVPAVHTKTWYHTGVDVRRQRVSSLFSALADRNDLPPGLPAEEQREACRALKGAILRQEIYALDKTPKAQNPYRVSEYSHTLRRLQPRGSNKYAVFFVHPRETIDHQYERNPTDARVSHTLTLEIDDFGDVLKSAAIGYGRRQPDMSLSEADRRKQGQTLVTFSENDFTNSISLNDAWRAPLPCEARSYELTGYVSSGANELFQPSDLVLPSPNGLVHSFDSELNYEDQPTNGRQRRLIEQVRTFYRPDDLGTARNDPLALLPPGRLEPLALPGETYRLAFTPGLLAQVYQRRQAGQPAENLLPAPTTILPVDATAGRVADRGGYVDLDGNGRWWVPTGRMFYSPGRNDTALQELSDARSDFFLPRRYRDPFHVDQVHDTQSVVTYDGYRLLVIETSDPVGNIFTARTTDDQGGTHARVDYNVLQAYWITDANGNRSQVAFDALGTVVGTAIMGKAPPDAVEGDSLASFDADLSLQRMDDFVRDPHALAGALLGTATTRVIHDVNRFRRTRAANPSDPNRWEPVFTATLARETHVSVPPPPGGLNIQIGFGYSDGFGREIQQKIGTEPGPAPRRDPLTGRIVVVDGRPEMTVNDVSPRWAGSGWTVFNNKGKPVRQFEPFFTDTHRFEFDVRVGVSPVLFYDPVGRVIATLHRNATYEKVVFDPWRQETWDVNDTVLLDPRTDDDIGAFAGQYLASMPVGWQTWHAARIGGALGPREQDAARKTSLHANTPAAAHFDTLGRPCLTLAHNGFNPDGTPVQFPTRVALDVQNNQREIRDAIVQGGDSLGRVVMRCDYDMLGTRIHQASMDAGERWMLNDVTGKPVRAWDGRGHRFRTEYDQLRRTSRQFVRGADATRSDPRTLAREVLFEWTEYGEEQGDDFARRRNLRTRVFRQYDGAGIATNLGLNPVTRREEGYDFKGNLLHSRRQLVQDYKVLPDWTAAPALNPPNSGRSTTYDALNRPVTLTAPDGSVIRQTYNEANLLNAIEVYLRGDAIGTPFVANIDYDAKGQRTRIEYGNAALTSFEYDPLTFRLTRLLTTRAGFAASGSIVQDLGYTHDPAGNIVHIRDDAQQAIYFDNHRVEPASDYVYDAAYRLIRADGREHIGQRGGSWTTYSDAGRVRLPHPHDGRAMRAYTELYDYDAVGNFARLIHQAANGNWTRIHAYNEPSLTEPATKSGNRLSSTTVRPNGSAPIVEPYAHDDHGNMIRMPHLQILQWDFKDQLYMSRRQAVDSNDADGIAAQGESTYYGYDAAGQRMWKATERQNGARKDERIYIGGFEIYRSYNGAGTTLTLERETLHVTHGKQVIALVETRISAWGATTLRAVSPTPSVAGRKPKRFI